MAEPTDAEAVAWLQGKLAWLAYLEAWMADHSGGGDLPSNAIQWAWDDFQKAHPEIANGPGFVRGEEPTP